MGILPMALNQKAQNMLKKMLIAVGLLVATPALAQTPPTPAGLQSAINAVPYQNGMRSLSGGMLQTIEQYNHDLFNSLGTWNPTTGAYTPFAPGSAPSLNITTPGCTSTTGAFDAGGSSAFIPTCSGVFLRNNNSVPTPSVNGSTTTTTAPPFTLDPVNIDQSMLLVRSIGNSPNTSETPFDIDFAVMSPQNGAASTNPNPANYGTEKVGFEEHVRYQPGQPGAGQIALSGWGANPETQCLGSTGQIALCIGREDDMVFGYSGTDDFAVHDWYAYAFAQNPVVATIYSTNQYPSAENSGNATVANGVVTSTSGPGFISGKTTSIRLNGSPYSVGVVTDSTHLTLYNTSTTISSASYTWEIPTAVDGILFGGNYNLNSNSDAHFTDSPITAVLVTGGQDQALNSSEAAHLRYAVLAGQGQKVCVNSADACLVYNGNGLTDYVQAGLNMWETDGANGRFNLYDGELLNFNGGGTILAGIHYNDGIGSIVFQFGASNPAYIDTTGAIHTAANYFAGASNTAGVTCAAGTPTSSFAAVGGIVTHC